MWMVAVLDLNIAIHVLNVEGNVRLGYPLLQDWQLQSKALTVLPLMFCMSSFPLLESTSKAFAVAMECGLEGASRSFLFIFLSTRCEWLQYWISSCPKLKEILDLSSKASKLNVEGNVRLGYPILKRLTIAVKSVDSAAVDVIQKLPLEVFCWKVHQELLSLLWNVDWKVHQEAFCMSSFPLPQNFVLRSSVGKCIKSSCCSSYGCCYGCGLESASKLFLYSNIKSFCCS